MATGGIVGAMIAPDKGLATLPISIYVLGLWLGALPVGWLARRYGRRTAFQIGTLCGVLTGLICFVAVMRGSFLLFKIGAFVSGLYASAHLAYRFAAADTASDAFRPKAISWVMIGGIFAGVVGPQVVILTKDQIPPMLFAATYLAQAVLAVIAGAVLMFLDIPVPPRRQPEGEGRPLREIARQPRFIVAVACGVASYSMMNLVMTSAPLAMVMCNHSVGDATLGLQWHVLGMFVPSFITGTLITRFGIERDHCHRLRLADHERDHQPDRHLALAFLDRAGAARRRLELRLHRCHRDGDAVPSSQRAQPGAVVQRFPGVRLDGDRFVSSGKLLHTARVEPRSTRSCSRPYSRPRRCWPGGRGVEDGRATLDGRAKPDPCYAGLRPARSIHGEETKMASRFSRRSLIAGATAVRIRRHRRSSAARRRLQIHAVPQSGSAPARLHKNLVAMWAAVRAQTNGRVETEVFAENNKLAGGDPVALKMLIAGEIQFFTLMGGIIGTVVPVAEAQQVPFAFKSAADAHRAIDGPFGRYIGEEMAAKGMYLFPVGWLRQRHASGRDHPAADRDARRLRRHEDPGAARPDDLRHVPGFRRPAGHDAGQ